MVKVLPLAHSVPVGTLVLPWFSELLTSSIPIWRVAIPLGSTCTRTAYFCAPYTCTCATPFTMEPRCAIVVSAASSTCDSFRVGELSARYRIGWSAGFTLRNEGGVGRGDGGCPGAGVMADGGR